MQHTTFFTIILLIAALCINCGCTDQTMTTNDEMIAAQQASYENFLDKTVWDFIVNQGGKDDSNYLIECDKILEAAGLEYEIKNGDIMITPKVQYTEEEDFRLLIHFDQHNVITSDSLETIPSDEGWCDIKNFFASSPCYTAARFGDRRFAMSEDECDYFWETVRTMTAPSDKVEEVQIAVWTELATYYEDYPDVVPEE